MDIGGKDVVILGGSGLVGTAVARALMPFAPRTLIVCGLMREEVEEAVEELRAEPDLQPETRLAAEWGNLFLPERVKERARADVLEEPETRRMLLDDLLGELTDAVLQRSALGALLERTRPAIIVDCVNTATAFAYQDIFESANRLRTSGADGGTVRVDEVERHLATLYLPQLIRHVQIALEGMRRAGTQMYVKVGTSGTGGMGLNIPFTHSEERPSRTLLAKAGVAGAHTLLLYLMARTPGAPAVKEIKPTAAISWKRIAYGAIRRSGRTIERWDATRALPLASAFSGELACERTGASLEGVYIDAGENGLFSMPEFETLSSLGLMEYITPEEIAADVVREIRGHPSGHDVVAALDAATAGPTYRAGVLREVAIARMAALERTHGVESIAYEMLGPPRLSKLLFEAAILARIVPDLPALASADAAELAARADALVQADADLRTRILSIGLPILLREGASLLRGPVAKVAPAPGQSPDDPRLAENGWVDLRPANWRKWSERARRMLAMTAADGGSGSRTDVEPDDRKTEVRPGRMAAWVFRYEDRGERIKR